jgi:hypothetical protein
VSQVTTRKRFLSPIALNDVDRLTSHGSKIPQRPILNETDDPKGQLPATITQAAVTADQRAPNVVPALIADLGDEGRLALCRIFHRQHPQPAYAPRLCAGLQPVLRLVRRPRPDAGGDPAARRRHLYRRR